MFVVQIEYEIVGEGFVESCNGFGKLNEAREFGHNLIDEIFDELGAGVEIDDAVVRIWHSGDGEIAENPEKEED
jgi:hypothetical protein